MRKRKESGQNAAAWFYGQPGFHGQPPASTIRTCKTCGKNFDTTGYLAPKVDTCGDCRVKSLLKEMI